MRPRSWLAVSAGTLTGSALAITGSPQSRARPTATTAHLRAPRTLTKMPARWSLARQGGHVIYIGQTPNNGTITARSRGTGSVASKSGSRLSSGDLLAV
jgi:hypothetical protein